MDGNDVQRLHQELALLGYEIRHSERQEKVFGENTQNGVRDFQRKRGLEPTGKVDARTARLINAAVAALLPREFVVKGQLKHQDGTPLDGITVQAFDKDLRREELLGEETTGEDGAYEIRYKTDQFARAEKKRADLIVRAFSPEGTLLSTATRFTSMSPTLKLPYARQCLKGSRSVCHEGS